MKKIRYDYFWRRPFNETEFARGTYVRDDDDRGPYMILMARLDRTGKRVLCGIYDCGEELARIDDYGVYRYVHFAEGWTGIDGPWHFSNHALRHVQRGEKPKSRRPNHDHAWTHQIRLNGKQRSVLCKCGKEQLLDPERLRINEATSYLRLIHSPDEDRAR
jgi:hypothetical protein